MNLAAVQTDEFCRLFRQWFAVSHLAFLGTAALSSTGSCDRSSPAVALKHEAIVNHIAPDGCGMWPLFTFDLAGYWAQGDLPTVQLVGGFEAWVDEVVWGIVTAG